MSYVLFLIGERLNSLRNYWVHPSVIQMFIPEFSYGKLKAQPTCLL